MTEHHLDDAITHAYWDREVDCGEASPDSARHNGPRASADGPEMGAWLLGSDPALALTGRKCVPTRLLREGHHFERPTSTRQSQRP